MSRAAKREPETKLAAQRAATRARLIRATLELLVQHGFYRLSLDMIAERAGVTKGAIYGNFSSKDALIVDALASRPDEGTQFFAWPTNREGTVRERLRRLGQAVLEGARRPGAAIAQAEFALYALTSDEMRARMMELNAMGPTRMGERVRSLFDPEELPMPVASFGLMLNALVPGIMYAIALSPRAIPDEEVLAIFEGMAGEGGTPKAPAAKAKRARKN